MSRIFLDVGSNTGQTIYLILQKKFKMDYIYGFEPSPLCCKILENKFQDNPRVSVIGIGLFSETCEMILYNEGSQGGTVHSDYQTTCSPELRETKCQFVRASEWFKNNIHEGDEVFLKLNCEGAECDIMIDLIDSGEYEKVRATLIDYDVRKSSSAQHKEQELRELLKRRNINNVHVFMGDHRHIILHSVLR